MDARTLAARTGAVLTTSFGVDAAAVAFEQAHLALGVEEVHAGRVVDGV